MAVTGLKHPIFAPIGTLAANARPTYSKGSVIAKAISADITINTADVKLFADDALDEYDNSFTGGTITFGINSLAYKDEAVMFGSKLTPSDSSEGELVDAANDISAEGGFGFYRVHKIGGKVKYEAVWLLRVTFKKLDESTQTRGDTVAFQTPSLSGQIMRVDGYNGGAWRERKMFDSEAECVTFLEKKAGIQS